MADVEVAKSLSGLLNGIAQMVYYNKSEITEELLKNELYPEMPPEEFKVLFEKMKGLIKVRETCFPICRYKRTAQNKYLCIVITIKSSEEYF